MLQIWSSSHLAPIEGTISDGPSNILYAKDFFDLNEPQSEAEQLSIRKAAGDLAEVAYGHQPEKMNYSEVSNAWYDELHCRTTNALDEAGKIVG